MRAVSVVLVFSLTFPGLSSAATITGLLRARDTQSVTRADFLRAAVTAAELVLPQSGAVPYDKVPDALLPYVRAAQSKKGLKVFLGEGRAVNFQKTIRRGEALAIMADLLVVSPSSASSEAVKAFTDVVSSSDTSLVSLALERNWMKPLSATQFGLKRPLKGKEGKLLLSRAFQLSIDDQPTDTMSSPVIRVKVTKSLTREPAPKADLFEEVWNALRRNYLYRDRLDTDKAGDKAIEGLVNSLGDPYTSYLPKTKNENFKLQMKGEIEGIGATVEMTGSILTIVSPLRGSPADKAGLKPKDQILKADGVSLTGLSLDDAVSHVRGPKGSVAVLVIRRGGTEFEIKVPRDKVLIPEIELSEDRNVTIVKILQFWDTTDKKFRDTMAEVQSKNPRGIILDLRNNPGGLLHAAGIVLSNFLPKGSPYISIMEIDATRTELTQDEPTIKESIPMIVLINKGSASASEIVAGTLQDAKRATLVGETTYGKGSVQNVLQLPDGSSLKYTIAEWKTPLGRKIDKVGVAPDVVVSNEGSTKDVQMEKAMELLR